LFPPLVSFPSPPLLPNILDKASLALLETFGFSGTGLMSFLISTGVFFMFSFLGITTLSSALSSEMTS
jgi:hypothetical protein